MFANEHTHETACSVSAMATIVEVHVGPGAVSVTLEGVFKMLARGYEMTSEEYAWTHHILDKLYRRIGDTGRAAYDHVYMERRRWTAEKWEEFVTW